MLHKSRARTELARRRDAPQHLPTIRRLFVERSKLIGLCYSLPLPHLP
jgi:hypothetical protein